MICREGGDGREMEKGGVMWRSQELIPPETVETGEIQEGVTVSAPLLDAHKTRVKGVIHIPHMECVDG